MQSLPAKLQNKLQHRRTHQVLRTLSERSNDTVDFISNDYLGFTTSKRIVTTAQHYLDKFDLYTNGATGSRLLSGNHPLYHLAESEIANFHSAEAALIFNSGYDANIGFFSSVLQRGDYILYDEYIHASIRDGILLSSAKGFKFGHNNIADLESKIQKYSSEENTLYVVTEAVFSMDGDCADVKSFAALCVKHNVRLIVDEAHAVGVYGSWGAGLVQALGLEKSIFARIVTFGKSLGCHGAAVLGSDELKQYLINFARSFVYTTGLPPHSVATILAAYNELKNSTTPLELLKQNIHYFKQEIVHHRVNHLFIPSSSAIHCAVLKNSTLAKDCATYLQRSRFDVRAICSPTVPEGLERIRICLHSFTRQDEIDEILTQLATFAKQHSQLTIA